MFFELNGYELAPDVTDDDVSSAILETAKGTMDEQTLAQWRRVRLVPLPPPTPAD
ncbi:MAG: hypothetical protein ACREON_13220 [Gemmatimonadaceae bacterium]